MTSFRAACVQLRTGRDVAANIAAAEALIRAAAGGGAHYIQTPEQTALMELERKVLFATIVAEDDDPALKRFRALAAELGVWLHIGSLAIRIGEQQAANRAFVIAPDGAIAARYDKVHMFDVDVDGVSYRESDAEAPGEEVVTAPAGELELGLSVCYDLRFPELYRVMALRGATAVTVPAAFTAFTGRDHWEVLLRARAIENQLFVIAAGQFGEAPPHFSSWGHSMIVDPWGRILGQIEAGEGHAIADLDLAELESVRERIPSLANRRPGAYEWPQEVSVGG